ncbi:vWA domain-containing protein [uncultured Methanobrevibacter sp.]|uniref:vWA domain-containing protein n=1 Tax=uncultured Methanobrevibacter sp. TaxID=253161 RepID=UPI0025D6CF76|nr:vWA domain-containing protein [uncultured Methanobrevibacter sp.]
MDKKSQNQDLDLVFVIDKSGSMWGSEEDTMGGFNAFIEKEKNKEFNTKVTTVLFNDGYDVLYERKDINDVDELTSNEYYVGGSTALLDAVGKTITSLNRKIDNKVLFVIMTDGMENSSVEYSKSQIKNMITSHNWEFIFIGAGIDSYSEASKIGIRKSRVANYKKSGRGVEDAYLSVENASCSIRMNKSLDDANWKKDLAKYD